MKPIFTPDMFEAYVEIVRLHGITKMFTAADAAAQANEILAKLIESAPKVTGHFDDDGIAWSHWYNGMGPHQDDTHTAVLMFIEELPARECEHEPAWERTISDREGVRKYFCKCGVELKCKGWEAK